MNKQRGTEKSRLGHETAPAPRVAAAGDEADGGGRAGQEAAVEAVWSRFEERAVKDRSRPAEPGGGP